MIMRLCFKDVGLYLLFRIYQNKTFISLPNTDTIAFINMQNRSDPDINKLVPLVKIIQQ